MHHLLKTIAGKLLGAGSYSEWVAVRDSMSSALRCTWRVMTRGQELRAVEGEGILVHLGCGPRVIEGWVNVDFDPPKGAFFADFRAPMAMGNGVAAHIHCEHVLEHLEKEVAQSFLRECARVLQPGGTIRVVVPDAGKYMNAYARGDELFFAPCSRIGGSVRPLTSRMEIVNQMFRMGGGHRYAWDFPELALSLEQAGFASVEQSEYGKADVRVFIDGSDEWRRHESLYVNARKPLRQPLRE
jgi:predicted SAM-dependent methyltransferase